jgi:hypothetical protein
VSSPWNASSSTSSIQRKDIRIKYDSTGVVVGINNNSNEDGQQCTVNNPCEVSANGEVIAQQGVRYGQQTFNVYTCLTPDFKFDLTLAGCDLPK